MSARTAALTAPPKDELLERRLPSGRSLLVRRNDGAEESVIKRAPKRGGQGVAVASHPHRIWAFTANATHVFWVDDKQRIFMAAKKPR